MCKANNGIQSMNEEKSGNDTEAKIVDIGTQFKKACTELALDKIWLQPLKIWELVRDEMVPKCSQGVVVPSSEQVRMAYYTYLHNYNDVSYITCYICLNTAGFLSHNLNPPDAMAATFLKIWEW